VVGAEPLAAELSQILAGRTAHDRPVRVRRLKASESLEGVHVLFVGREESAQLNQLASKAQQRSILIVSESERALAQGSAINFVIDEGRVRFEVSLVSARKSNVKLSSRLLAVAQQVMGAP
jgi:diadenosine tetraphosphate (Ap4A) HIT family hydrolase